MASTVAAPRSRDPRLTGRPPASATASAPTGDLGQERGRRAPAPTAGPLARTVTRPSSSRTVKRAPAGATRRPTATAAAWSSPRASARATSRVASTIRSWASADRQQPGQGGRDGDQQRERHRQLGRRPRPAPLGARTVAQPIPSRPSTWSKRVRQQRVAEPAGEHLVEQAGEPGAGRRADGVLRRGDAALVAPRLGRCVGGRSSDDLLVRRDARPPPTTLGPRRALAPDRGRAWSCGQPASAVDGTRRRRGRVARSPRQAVSNRPATSGTIPSRRKAGSRHRPSGRAARTPTERARSSRAGARLTGQVGGEPVDGVGDPEPGPGRAGKGRGQRRQHRVRRPARPRPRPGRGPARGGRGPRRAGPLPDPAGRRTRRRGRRPGRSAAQAPTASSRTRCGQVGAAAAPRRRRATGSSAAAQHDVRRHRGQRPRPRDRRRRRRTPRRPCRPGC